jgi:putative tricarboxylic transport membrane protein
MLLDVLSTIPEVFIQVATPLTLAWIFLGVMVGVIFGAIPGLTALTAVAIFTPITFLMSFETAFGFLIGIYCGGFYAGSIPAILLKTPGAPGNAATALDGYPMALQGKAGLALGLSIISSFIGGIVSAFALLFIAPLLGTVALKFGAAEYFSLGILGLLCVAGISGNSILKGLIGATIGMLLGVIGMDPIIGTPRFTMGHVDMMGGIALIPALVGLFAIPEVLSQFGKLGVVGKVLKVDTALPKVRDFIVAKWTLVRSILIGIGIGILPGIGPTIASWMSYTEARRNSKHPEEFGKGSAEGIIACESSNNAVPGGAMIPLLTLGIPGDSITAVMLGALMIQGLTPGPMLLATNYDIIASILWILIWANVFMLFVGVAGAKTFPYIMKVPNYILMPIIIVLCVAGSYASNNSLFDVKMMIVVGILGYILSKFDISMPPIVLGFILGPIIESNFRRALVGTNPSVFVTEPISAGILAIAAVMLFFIIRNNLKETSLPTVDDEVENTVK